MYNSIILSSFLFGSVYLFSKSLEQINHILLEEHKGDNKHIKKLIIINSLTCIISGSLFIDGITHYY